MKYVLSLPSANANLKNINGLTPYACIVSKGNLKLLEYMLNHCGVDVFVTDSIDDLIAEAIPEATIEKRSTCKDRHVRNIRWNVVCFQVW